MASMLPLIIGGICAALHFIFGVAVLGLGSKKRAIQQHHIGFPVWYYFTASGYILFCSGSWSLWLIMAEALAFGEDVTGTIVFAYMPAWCGTLLYIVLLILAITTSLHILIMHFILFKFHTQRGSRREIRMPDKSSLINDPQEKIDVVNNKNNLERGEKKNVLFDIQTSHSWTATFVSLTSPINWLIQMMHQLVFVDFSLIWFFMPFIEYVNYKSFIYAPQPLQILNERTMLKVQFGDFYFFWLKTKLLNAITFGIYERCCARHTYGEWLDHNLMWKNKPPTGFNNDFKYFSAQLLYWEVVVVFLIVLLSSMTLFITLPITLYWYRTRRLMKLRLGGRAPKLKHNVTGKEFLHYIFTCEGNMNEYFDRNIHFDTNSELWYWDNGLCAVKSENKKLRNLLDANNIDISIPNSIHINPLKVVSPKINTCLNKKKEEQKVAKEQSMVEIKIDIVEQLPKTTQERLSELIEGMLLKYDLNEEQLLTIEEIKPFIEEHIGRTISERDCKEFLISIDENGDGKIEKDELINFVKMGLELADDTKLEYAKRGEFHKTIIDFFDAVNSKLVSQSIDRKSLSSVTNTINDNNKYNVNKEITLATLIDEMFAEYDLDKNGLLNAKEIKPCIEEYIGYKITEERCNRFLISIDESGDGEIDKKEFINFIQEGLELTDSLRRQYAERGEFHRTIIEFFKGIDDRLKRLQLLKPGKMIVYDVEKFLDKIWKMYDHEESGSLNAKDIKMLLKDFTGRNVQEKMCNQFLQGIDSNGDSLIEKNEMKLFIEDGIELSKEDKQAYAARGGLHATIIEFFDGVNSRLKLGKKYSNNNNDVGNEKEEQYSKTDIEIERLRKEFTGGYKSFSSAPPSFVSSNPSKILDTKDMEIARLKKAFSASTSTGVKKGEFLKPRFSSFAGKKNVIDDKFGPSSVISPTTKRSTYSAGSKLKGISQSARNNLQNSKSALGVSASPSNISASKSNFSQLRRSSGGNIGALSATKRNSPVLRSTLRRKFLSSADRSGSNTSVLGNRRGGNGSLKTSR